MLIAGLIILTTLKQGIGLIMLCFLVARIKTTLSTVMCAISVLTNAFKESAIAGHTQAVIIVVSVSR